jgi:hypothetical protein
MARPTGPGVSFHHSSQSIGMSRVAPRSLASVVDVQNLHTIGFWSFCTFDRTTEGLDRSPISVRPVKYTYKAA